MNHADFATRCHAIELMVDSLGDAAYQLAGMRQDDWHETHDAIVQVCDGLHALDAIVKRTAPATSGANAPDMDRESTSEHHPSHAPDVQTIEGKRA